jgi:hypothetical protein
VTFTRALMVAASHGSIYGEKRIVLGSSWSCRHRATLPPLRPYCRPRHGHTNPTSCTIVRASRISPSSTRLYLLSASLTALMSPGPRPLSYHLCLHVVFFICPNHAIIRYTTTVQHVNNRITRNAGVTCLNYVPLATFGCL